MTGSNGSAGEDDIRSYSESEMVVAARDISTKRSRCEQAIKEGRMPPASSIFFKYHRDLLQTTALHH